MNAPDAGRPRLIVANLDCDVAFARLSNPSGPSETLSESARAVAAATGSILRVFAEPGDRLRLCGSLDPARLTESLPSAELARHMNPADALHVLPWAMTLEVTVAARANAAATASAVGDGNVNLGAAIDDTDVEQGSIVERAWRCARADPVVTAATNHRATALEVARELDVALTGAAAVSSVQSLLDHVSATLHPRAWVVKGAHSSAGRARAWIASRADLDPGARPRAAIERLLRAHGSVVVEPWHDRIGDYAVNGFVTDDAWIPSGLTATLVDERGVFRGVDLGVSIPDPIAGSLLDSSARVAHALLRRGYRGPLGIDAWSYRDESGEHLNTLGELNARLTFGHVALAVREKLGLRADLGWRLEMRRVPKDHAFPREAIPLLLAGSPDEFAAWIVPTDGARHRS